MKRMSEVFELPVASNRAYMAEVLEYAAHAINNADALADALSAALPALQYNRSISDSADRIYTDAALALQAYRGTK